VPLQEPQAAMLKIKLTMQMMQQLLMQLIRREQLVG
jgi:hypothetical protein